MLRVVRIDERNLCFCEFLSLSDAYELSFLDVQFLGRLRVLILWRSGIVQIDLMCLEHLELVVYGISSQGTTQIVTARPEVSRRRYDANGNRVE